MKACCPLSLLLNVKHYHTSPASCPRYTWQRALRTLKSAAHVSWVPHIHAMCSKARQTEPQTTSCKIIKITRAAPQDSALAHTLKVVVWSLPSVRGGGQPIDLPIQDLKLRRTLAVTLEFWLVLSFCQALGWTTGVLRSLRTRSTGSVQWLPQSGSRLRREETNLVGCAHCADSLVLLVMPVI